MKTYLKIISAVLSLATLLSMAACKNDGSEESTDPANIEQTSEPATQADLSVAGTEKGVDATEAQTENGAVSEAETKAEAEGLDKIGRFTVGNVAYVIGATGALTEEGTGRGDMTQLGAQLAADEINSSGGVNGRDLVFLMLDDSDDPEKTAEVYRILFESGMQAAIGSPDAAASKAFAEKAKDDGVFVATVASDAGASVKLSDRCFSIYSENEPDVSFGASFEARYGKEPDSAAASAYDAVYLICELIKASGADNVKVDPDELGKALQAVATDPELSFSFATGELEWDKNGLRKD